MTAALRSAKPLRLLARLAAAAALFGLAACAEASRPEQMVAAAPAQAPLPGEIYRVSEVVGGEKTNPIVMSKVSDGAFQRALELSLEQAGMWDAVEGMPIRATLIALDQPIVGFDFTVKATARYQVHDAAGEELWDEIFTTPYTANFTDSIIGVKRLQLANEGAIKANIAAFMKALIEQKLPQRAAKADGAPTS